MIKRSQAQRVAIPLFSIVSALCSAPVGAEGWTSNALIGNIQSFSDGSPSSGSTTHYFRSATAPNWEVVNGGGICSSPIFVYLDSSQYGHRELLATVMLAKALGKQVQFIGICTATNYFKTHYVLLVD